VFRTGSSRQPIAALTYERYDVFRTGSSRQAVAALTYERHDVFRTGSSRQPVDTISFTCAALFVHTKVLFSRKVTSEELLRVGTE
jgi:hypothetical protein